MVNEPKKKSRKHVREEGKTVEKERSDAKIPKLAEQKRKGRETFGERSGLRKTNASEV